MPHWSAVEPEFKYNDLRSLELQRKLELSPLLSLEAQAWPTVGPSDWWLMGLQSALPFQTLASARENPAALRNRLYSFLLNTSHRCELPVSSELFIIHTMVSVLRKNYDSIFCKTKCPMNWWTKVPKTRGQVDLHEIGNRFMSTFFLHSWFHAISQFPKGFKIVVQKTVEKALVSVPPLSAQQLPPSKAYPGFSEQQSTQGWVRIFQIA